jgi:hypothetical protein
VILRWLESDDSSAVRCRMHTMLSFDYFTCTLPAVHSSFLHTIYLLCELLFGLFVIVLLVAAMLPV